MCLYFLDQTSFEGDMSFLSFKNLWFGISYIHETTNIFMKQQNSHKSTEWPLIMKKCTYIPPNFKVGENNEPFFFLGQTSFEGDMRYDIFLIGDLIMNIRKYIFKSQNAHISVILFLNKKIRSLYILQLWKLEKQNCTYFHNRSSSW